MPSAAKVYWPPTGPEDPPGRQAFAHGNRPPTHLRHRLPHRRRADARRHRRRAGPRRRRRRRAARRFREQHDRFRSAVVNEPRGSDVLVGALLCEPADPACAAGVIFFNNVGYLGMCGHGTIGLVVTLAHLGRIAPGVHRIETPVGVVAADAARAGDGLRRNVAELPPPQGRPRRGATGTAPCTGDVAWGGNWFFLVRATTASRCELQQRRAR